MIERGSGATHEGEGDGVDWQAVDGLVKRVDRFPSGTTDTDGPSGRLLGKLLGESGRGVSGSGGVSKGVEVGDKKTDVVICACA